MRTRRGEITTCCESYAPLGTLWASARFPYHSLNVGLWTISRLGAVCAVNSHCMETYNFTSVRFLFAQLRQWENYRLKGNDCTAQMCKAYPATDFLSHFGWLSAVFGVPSRVFVLVKKKKKNSELRSCVEVEVAVLSSPSPIVLMVSVSLNLKGNILCLYVCSLLESSLLATRQQQHQQSLARLIIVISKDNTENSHQSSVARLST